MRLLDSKTADALWNRLFKEYKFRTADDSEWISFPQSCRTYHKDTPWSPEQEKTINSFLEELINGEMYALDWQHDCFAFSPSEHIPFDYNYYDDKRDCQVYFPTYYPDGDHYFFFDAEWKYGIFGHPWRHEIVVIGEKLINKFEANKEYLGI